MTRENNQYQFGSVSRNLKRIFTIGCLLFSGEAQANLESSYKMRMHKSLIANALSVNFPVALEHIGGKTQWNQYLTGAMVNVEKINMKIAPEIGKEWEHIGSDVFFDEGQIVIELKDLEIRGTGEIQSSTGTTETLKIRAPIELC